MDLGEYIFMRIFLVFFIGAILFGIRVILMLIKKGIGKLTEPRKEEVPAPQVSRSPTPPAVTPQAPPAAQPPVTPRTLTEKPTLVQPVSSSGPPEIYGGWTPWFQPLQLRMLNGPLAGRIYPLMPQDPASQHTIGRNPTGTVVFPADTPGISGNHCRVEYHRLSGPSLVDCGSTYGTYLSDGRRLQPNVPTQIPVGESFYLAGRNGVAICLEQANKGGMNHAF